MRQVMRKGLITVAAATGVLAVTGGYAHADSGAHGAAVGSPGVLSGNLVQAPVDIPVNVCGNTVNVLGAGNLAAGNGCGNGTASEGGHHSSGGGSSASGHTGGSAGVGSGNQVQAPVEVPVNVCGNSVNVASLGDVAVGDDCVNTGGHHEPPIHPTSPTPGHPGTPEQPGKPHHPVQPADHHPQSPVAEQLAETGSGLPLGAALTASGGALLAGVVLYRKARDLR